MKLTDLVDQARRQAVFRRHQAVHPAHLALAWSELDRDTFDLQLGEPGRSALSTLLRAMHPAEADAAHREPTVEAAELLRWLGQADFTTERLGRGLRSLLDLSPPPAWREHPFRSPDSGLEAQDLPVGGAESQPQKSANPGVTAPEDPDPKVVNVEANAPDPNARRPHTEGPKTAGSNTAGSNTAGPTTAGSNTAGRNTKGPNAPAAGAGAPSAWPSSHRPTTSEPGGSMGTFPAGGSPAPADRDDAFGATVETVLALLAQREPGTPCLVGASGSGRSTVLTRLADRLSRETVPPLAGTTLEVVRAEQLVGSLGSEQYTRLHAGGDVIRGVDDLDVLLFHSASQPGSDVAGAIRSLAGPGRRAVFTLDEAYRGRLRQSWPELHDELTFVAIPPLDATQLRRVARAQSALLSRHHGVAVAPEAVETAMLPRAPRDARAHPGLLVDRLDRACTAARRAGRREVSAADLDASDDRLDRPRPAADLFAALSRRVIGQDEALRAISGRLALTTAGLDLRPRRPNAVFLLAGPTGVGKSAIGLALAETLFGAEDALIRLDLSEFGERHAVSRLFGPPPGYLGSDSPEGWFTSRVLARPRSVILLDEVEKAAPEVWNVFLQVFDDGRLTDSSGVEVSFAETVIVLTSNLGARVFGAGPLGFAAEQSDVAAAAMSKVDSAVRAALPAEFVNRLDAVLICQPLTESSIAGILDLELDRALPRLAERGWTLMVTPAARTTIARSGYEPAYGARHLQRNIDRLVLQSLVERPRGAWHLDATPELIWSADPRTTASS